MIALPFAGSAPLLAALAVAAALLVPAARATDVPGAPEPPAASTPVPAPAAQVLVMLRDPAAHARLDGGYAGSVGYGDAASAQARARVAARIAAAHGFTLVTRWAMPALGMDCIVMALPPGADLEASIAALETHAEVAWAQPMNEFEAQGHADPLYPLQPAATLWHLDDLHSVATGRGVRVAIVDSGVDAAHPDLSQAVETQANFVDGQRYVAETHGTAVAGLVAARADNGIGIVGIAPDARLLALRACWEVNATQTLCNSLSLAKALDFAIEHNADVINMSLSGPTDTLLGRLIDIALAKRQQVVAAVDARTPDGGFPATHPGVIAVADPRSAGPQLPSGIWTAPAQDLPTTVPGGAWRLVSGSSFAAGQVAGLLAVLDQARGTIARAPSATDGLVRLPGGAIDACASLVRAASLSSVPARPKRAPACEAMLATTAAAPGP